MKIKTSDLTRATLNWAVAKCEGLITGDELDIGFINEGGYIPPTDWPQGGPIIEREGITLRCGLHGWDAELEEFDAMSHGPTALIAAMRCYVATKPGEEVDVPDELIESMK